MDILTTIPVECSLDDCSDDWHLTYYRVSQRGEFYVEEFALRPRMIEESEVPLSEDIERCWLAYYVYAAETGLDPLVQLLTPTNPVSVLLRRTIEGDALLLAYKRRFETRGEWRKMWHRGENALVPRSLLQRFALRCPNPAHPYSFRYDGDGKCERRDAFRYLQRHAEESEDIEIVSMQPGTIHLKVRLPCDSDDRERIRRCAIRLCVQFHQKNGRDPEGEIATRREH